VAIGFCRATFFAEVFFAVFAEGRGAARFVALRVDLTRADLAAAFRVPLRRVAFRVVFAALRAVWRPLDRAPVRELFRAAFLVLPAALRLAIVCSFGAPI
jgi:hypothetical protein